MMTPELTYLLWAVILLIAHTIVQATFSDLSKGIGWALGPQDENRDQNLIAGRIERALANYLETLPAFVALALMLAVTESGTATSALGAAVWFWARIAYIPAYASGIPLVRSVAWFASLAGLVMMILPFFQVSHELTALALSALWQMLVFAAYATRANMEIGPGYTTSPRDREPSREMTTATARLGRAYDNHPEWLLLFAIAVGVTEFTAQHNALTAMCAWAYLAARVAYVPAYVLGLSPWRSAIWAVGFLATLLMLLAALI